MFPPAPGLGAVVCVEQVLVKSFFSTEARFAAVLDAPCMSLQPALLGFAAHREHNVVLASADTEVSSSGMSKCSERRSSRAGTEKHQTGDKLLLDLFESYMIWWSPPLGPSRPRPARRYSPTSTIIAFVSGSQVHGELASGTV